MMAVGPVSNTVSDPQLTSVARRRARRRRSWRALATGAALVAAVSGCGQGARNGTIQATGHVEAIEVRLAARVGGRLARFDPIEGDKVAAGQAVAVIDSVDLAGDRDRRLADLATARANLALLEAGTRREDIAAGRAALARAQADLDGANRDLSRLDELLQHGAVARQARDDAATRRDMAEAAVNEARAGLKRLEAGPRPEELAAARARVAAAEADLGRAQQALADAVITAPRGGIISEKLVEAGEMIGAGTPLAVLVDLETAWLNVYVPEPDLGRIRIGQAARVTTDDGQARTGTVSFIAPEAEFTPKNVQTKDERVKLVYRLKIALDNRDGLFKPGMPAEATLEAAAVAGR
jgi:HlyD family secretion protein